MTNIFKRIIVFIVCIGIIIVTVSVGYFSNLFKNSRTIEDVDNLSGQRIGVMTAYEGDYLLSDRKDITLLRYDSLSDVMVALCYQQVDAVAILEDNAKYVIDNSTGFKINEKPIASNGMASLYVENSKYMQEFADFLEDYKASGEYDKFIAKYTNDEYYDGSLITEETGTGEVIRVGYIPDFLPVIFKDTKQNCANGSEADITRLFANYMNYQIEWVDESETTGISDLCYEKIDILLSGYTEVYRAECENSPYLDMGPVYRESSIVLLEVEDYNNIAIMADLEEIE